MRRRREPEAVARVAGRVLSRAGIGRRTQTADPGSSLRASFERAAGSVIAAHATPVRLHQGTLYLAVDSSVWLQELTFLRDEIAKRMAALLGQPVRAIRLQVAPERISDTPAARGDGPAPTGAPALAAPELSPRTRAEAARAVAPLREVDDEIADAAERALGLWKARAERRGGK